MTRLLLNRLLGIAAAIVIALVSSVTALVSSAAATDCCGQTVVADGVLIYLGVMPSNVLRNDPGHYGDHNEQCPVPGGGDNHHVLIALFDQLTGERIVDADVYVRVSSLGLVGPRKHFGAVDVDGAVTYCNYFDMPATDRYDVKIEIKRVESPEVIHAKFTYRPYGG